MDPVLIAVIVLVVLALLALAVMAARRRSVVRTRRCQCIGRRGARDPRRSDEIHVPDERAVDADCVAVRASDDTHATDQLLRRMRRAVRARARAAGPWWMRLVSPALAPAHLVDVRRRRA